jgi:hypothetical protein
MVSPQLISPEIGIVSPHYTHIKFPLITFAILIGKHEKGGMI